MRKPGTLKRGLAATLLTCAALLICAGGTALAQQVLGVFDPGTGVLAPATTAQPAALAPAAATVATSGTVDVDVQFTFGAEIPGANLPYGQANLRTADPTFVNSSFISPPVTRSGRSGSASFSIPYDWRVAQTGETASLVLGFSTSAADGTYYAYNQTLAFVLPRTGATKSYTVKIGF